MAKSSNSCSTPLPTSTQTSLLGLHCVESLRSYFLYCGIAAAVHEKGTPFFPGRLTGFQKGVIINGAYNVRWDLHPQLSVYKVQLRFQLGPEPSPFPYIVHLQSLQWSAWDEFLGCLTLPGPATSW